MYEETIHQPTCICEREDGLNLLHNRMQSHCGHAVHLTCIVVVAQNEETGDVTVRGSLLFWGLHCNYWIRLLPRVLSRQTLVIIQLTYTSRGLGFGVWGLGFGVWGLGFGRSE